MRRSLLWGTLLLAALGGLTGQEPIREPAAPPSPAGGTTPLGIRQQRVERMMEELERKFKSLKIALQQTEPERAERLQATLNRAKELLIQQRMSDITQLLDQAQLDTATDSQKALLADIRALLALLLNEKSDRDKAREEFERLSQWKEEIHKLIRQERSEKRESDRLAKKDETLADLAARIQAVEEILRQEQQLVAQTQAARTEGIQRLAPIARQQAQVRQRTEAIAGQMAQEAGDPPPDRRLPDSPPANRPAPSPPPATTPAPPASPPAANPAAPPAASLSPEPSPAPAAPPRPPEPGERPLRQAIDDQRTAERELDQAKGRAAQQAEEAAVSRLEQALAELKKERQRIASLPPEAFDRLARKQEDLARQADQLQQQMQQAAGQAGKPQPGQGKVGQAQQSMQQAGGSLQRQRPDDASRQEGKAIQELEEALAEIEERLAQLREETQLEKLARLEARFREMLAAQQRLTAETLAWEQKRLAAGGQLARSARNAVRAIGDEERRMEAVRAETEKKEPGLAGKAQQVLDILLDDGTSVVFPDVVEHLRDDLLTAGNLLADNLRTDLYTTTLQREIETTLQELIDALQQLQQQKQAAGGGGGGGGGREPLLPNSAELKLLRAAQLRINRRTAALDQARPAGGALDEPLQGEVQKIAERQREIAEMTIQILERGR